MVQQNFAVNLDDAVYQAAQGRAQAEGKSLEQALLELLGVYAQDAPAVTSYTVQRGDTLSKIARTVYGDAYQYPLIQKANNLGDPGNIWVGQVLVIPAIAGTAPPPPSSPPPPDTASPAFNTATRSATFYPPTTSPTTASATLAAGSTCTQPGRLRPGYASWLPARSGGRAAHSLSISSGGWRRYVDRLHC